MRTAPPLCHGCKSQTEVFLTLPNTPLQIERLSEKPGPETQASQTLIVARCTSCGLLQQISKPLDPEYYDDYEQSASLSEAMSTYQAALAQEIFNDVDAKAPKVLEIGAGDGFFARALMDLGAEVLAIEPGAPSVASIRERGVPVLHGLFDRASVSDMGPFDVIISRQVISHVEPLGDFLDDVAAVCKPGARVYFECPNIVDSLLQGRFVDFLPDYRSYLSVATITQLMEARGFKLWEARPRWNGEYFQTTFIREDETVADITGAISALKAELSVERGAGRKVAVWGAGGRGISLLAQLQLTGGDVAYVIDSSALKQGKFTPGSGIEVKSAAALAEDPVDTILLTPVNYASEIMEELRRVHNFQGEILLPFPSVRRITLT